jgi:hypothetical protein
VTFLAFGILFGSYAIFMRRFQRMNRDALLGAFDRATVADFEMPGGTSTFRCQHMSIMNVSSASCGICGPMTRLVR